MEVKINDDQLENMLRDAIRAQVVGAVGTPAMIGKLVDAALAKKSGSYGDYRSEIERICASAIQESARNVMMRYVEENRAAMEASIEAALDKNKDQIAVALINGLLAGATADWRFAVTLRPSQPTSDED